MLSTVQIQAKVADGISSSFLHLPNKMPHLLWWFVSSICTVSSDCSVEVSLPCFGWVFMQKGCSRVRKSQNLFLYICFFIFCIYYVSAVMLRNLFFCLYKIQKGICSCCEVNFTVYSFVKSWEVLCDTHIPLKKNGQNVATAFHYLFEAKRKQKVPCQTNSLSVLLTELNLLPSRKKKKAELIFI